MRAETSLVEKPKRANPKFVLIINELSFNQGDKRLKVKRQNPYLRARAALASLRYAGQDLFNMRIACPAKRSEVGGKVRSHCLP